jgi:hypothetical protein
MASEAPDPRNFKSWEDAFQFPIPVVRKLESQLRTNAGDNREKLRSLVGSEQPFYAFCTWLMYDSVRATVISSIPPKQS